MIGLAGLRAIESQYEQQPGSGSTGQPLWVKSGGYQRFSCLELVPGK